METNRHRGGQPGNKNALKHGYYSKAFNKEERKDYCSAGEVDGIDEEIALLRRIIKKAASSDDDKQIDVLVRATGALNRLVRTRFRLRHNGKYDGLNEAVRNVVKDVLVPLGVVINEATIRPLPPPAPGTNTRNEADLP